MPCVPGFVWPCFLSGIYIEVGLPDHVLTLFSVFRNSGIFLGKEKRNVNKTRGDGMMLHLGVLVVIQVYAFV